ncbi:EAL domain-containing protein [Aestuariivirga sp.]|uniref:EAL domain-containing protein n=1 Tax=Aestuariivirga sp. TaxID=2650926 RepID=UPI00391CFB21
MRSPAIPGSKFGIILNRCSEEDLAVAAERFLSVARDSVIETARGPVWALLSMGALVLPAQAEDPNLAVARAEEALAEARKLPSDGIVIYRPSPERSAARALNAESASEIVRCLREERFRLAFQPVVCARTGKPLFHEALLRMTGPTGATVSAGHLIPIAEKLGLVRLIDRAVVQMAVATLARHPGARLSLNLSGTTATDPRWHGQIIDLIAAQPGIADRLIVEITETVALGDLSETIRFVERLRGLGCSVAIDDFGAGYTSFRNLRALAVDMLKLDGTFCSHLAETPDHQYFVKSLIELGHTFGLKTVAEWVESEADAALLRDWGVDMMQGNLFGAASLETPWQAADPASAMPFTLGQMPFDQPARPEEDDMDKELFELAEASAARLAEEEENEELFPPPPAQETVERYERMLEGDLAALRRAIAALDGAFSRPSAPETGPETVGEPSFADLVSDTAFRRVG